jgi:hypothetical protein
MSRFADIALLFFGVFSVSAQAQVKVFILAGQSNAVGFGGNADDLPDSLREPFDDVLFWYDIGGRGVNPVSDTHVRPREGTRTWVPLRPQEEFGGRVAFDKPGAGFTGQNITTGHGVELTLGRSLAAALDDEIAILKFAFNGTSLARDLTTVDWNVASRGEYFDRLVQETSTALDHLETDLATSGTVAGLFWMQGGADAYPGTAELYEANLLALVDAARDEWGESLPVVVAQEHKDLIHWMHPVIPGIEEPYLSVVRSAQQNVVASSPFTAIVDLDDVPLTSDFSHLDSAGLQIAGQRFADAYLALASQPLRGDYDASGVVEQADLDVVLLNWGSEITDPAAAGWLNDLPSGPVDQGELDKVLLGWGSTAEDATGAAIPEPSSLLLVAVVAMAAVAVRVALHRRR